MTEAAPLTPALEMRSISKRFGAVQALSGVDFEVYAGEVLGLVGDNGAGKSTLIKCISGIYPVDTGEIYFEGKPVTINGPKDSARLGIETVYQDLALCDNLDVVANLYLGREQTDRIIPKVIEPIDEVGMEKRSLDVLRSLSVSLPNVRTIIASLSGGQRQSVAVARAVMWNSKVVLLDEPTAALGVAQSKQVLDLIRRLKSQGLAVVVISHNLADVFEVVDRIIVLRLGRRVGTFNIHSTSREQIVAAITGAEFGALESENGKPVNGGQAA
ncbi:MAG TPA: ATP-binding cassette domain-containing protein [Anaerolineales bacterium]